MQARRLPRPRLCPLAFASLRFVSLPLATDATVEPGGLDDVLGALADGRDGLLLVEEAVGVHEPGGHLPVLAPAEGPEGLTDHGQRLPDLVELESEVQVGPVERPGE